MANDLNAVRFFLTREDLCRTGVDGYVTEAAFYDAFWKFAAMTEGARPPALKAFKRMVDGLKAEFNLGVDMIRDPRTGIPVTVIHNVELVAKAA